jgi:hypothetical protein
MVPALALVAAFLSAVLSVGLFAVIVDLRLKHQHVRVRLDRRGGFGR